MQYNADDDGERCARTVRVHSTRCARERRVLRVLLACFVKGGDRSGAFRLDSSHGLHAFRSDCPRVFHAFSSRWARFARTVCMFGTLPFYKNETAQANRARSVAFLSKQKSHLRVLLGCVGEERDRSGAFRLDCSHMLHAFRSDRSRMFKAFRPTGARFARVACCVLEECDRSGAIRIVCTRCARIARVFSMRVARWGAFCAQKKATGRARFVWTVLMFCVRFDRIVRVSSTRFARYERVLRAVLAFVEFRLCGIIKQHRRTAPDLSPSFRINKPAVRAKREPKQNRGCHRIIPFRI